MKDFTKRTLVGAAYVAIIILTIYGGRLMKMWWNLPDVCGMALFNAVFLIVGIIGTHEIIDLLRKRGMDIFGATAYLVSILTYLILITFFYDDELGKRLRYLLPALWLSVALIALWKRSRRPFAAIGYTLLPSLWVMVPLALMAHLQLLGLVMMIFILIWMNDSFAYMTGRLLGRHTMWRRHSPKKTWEGTIGGAVFCVVAAEVVGPLFAIKGIGWLDWLAIGLICSTVGTLGDLVESMFKRSCGVKDSGNVMPGHGGILDRFDSMLMTVPFIISYLMITGY